MNNGEAVWADWVSCGIDVLMDGGWDPEMFFEPVPKCSPRLSSVLLRTVYVWEFEFVDNPALLNFVVPVLGCHEQYFYSVCTFEVYSYSLVVACPFEFLSQSLDIWNYSGNVIVVVSSIVVVVVGLIVCGTCFSADVVLVFNIFCSLLRTHVWKWQDCKAFLTWSSCPSIDIGLCVWAFPETVVMRVLLAPGVSLVSRNRRDPSWFGSSIVNCMCGSCV